MCSVESGHREMSRALSPLLKSYVLVKFLRFWQGSDEGHLHLLNAKHFTYVISVSSYVPVKYFHFSDEETSAEVKLLADSCTPGRRARF